MNETKFVKPRKGLIIRFPNTNTILPEKGAIVPWNGREGSYWRRRVNCGDVKIVDSSKKEEKAIKPDYKNKSLNFNKEVK